MYQDVHSWGPLLHQCETTVYVSNLVDLEFPETLIVSLIKELTYLIPHSHISTGETVL